MRLREIEAVIIDEVCLYIRVDDNNFNNLWKGKSKDIPEKFLDYTVVVIGAKQKNILDIELRR